MGHLQSTILNAKRVKNAKDKNVKYDLTRDLRQDSTISTVEVERPIQLVLYGPGEAGKTTFAHRMMLIHGHDLSKERHKWRPLVCFNLLEGIFLIVKNGMRIYKRKFKTEEEEKKSELILFKYRIFQNNILSCNLDNDAEIVEAIFYLVDNSPLFKKLIQNRAKFALFDSWLYLVEKLRDYPTWGGKDWVPSNEDILRSRNRSVGAKAFSFLLNDQKFIMTDLGGQKSERILRLVFTLSLDCLLFFVSLANYDEVLFEDHTGNRLTDSLRVWKECVSSGDFKNKMIILFLNKFDLFQIKYFDQKKPINLRFNYNIQTPKVEDEEDDRECPLAIEWFKELYRNQIPRNKETEVKIYVTSQFNEEELSKTVNKGLTFIANNIIV